MRNIFCHFIAFIVIASGQALSREKKLFCKIPIIKIITCFLIATLFMSYSQAIAQVTEGYIPGNLGRIVEICNEQGLLPEFHTLIGYDSNGSVKASNSTSAYRIFARYPNLTNLNPPNDYSGFNYYGRFGAPGMHDCYEIRYGTDSSRYWIRTGNFLYGGTLAPNKLPFSVYNVSYRPSRSRDTSGGIKLCIQVQDEDNNGIYTPGERIAVYGDLTLPMDSTYAVFGNSPTNKFNFRHVYFSNFRTGLSSVSYNQNLFSVPADGIIPSAGTVIRLVSAGSDTAAPIIYAPGDIIAPNPGRHEFSLGFYSYEIPSIELIESPSAFVLQNGKLVWNNTIPYGMSLLYTIRATNSHGYSQNTRQAHSGYRITEKYSLVRLEAGELTFYTSNNGSIAYNWFESNYGMGWRDEPVSLFYATGFYLAGKKRGFSGDRDTITVTNVEFESEWDAGRILNQGPLGSLIVEDKNSSAQGVYVLPDHTSIWPTEAPHDSLNQPLKLSARDTWTVFNDVWAISKSIDPYRDSLAPAFGIECQRQTFQFLDYPFHSSVLVRLRLINRCNVSYDSVYFALWADPDVGTHYSDDLAMVDSVLPCLVTYSNPQGNDPSASASGLFIIQKPVVSGNATDTASIVTISRAGFQKIKWPHKKQSPPAAAVAYDFLDQFFRHSDITRYNFSTGLTYYGVWKPNGIFDLTSTGSLPGDQRVVVSVGPFTFAAGDTQEVWYALMGAKGTNKANAVDSILSHAHLIKDIFYNNLNSVIVGIDEPLQSLPQRVTLYPNYPNPFNPSTVISYQLAVSSKVSLKIYNLLGQEVRTLINTQQSSGIHTAVWDGKNNHGQRVSSGVYLYRLEAGDFVKTRKMVLVK